MKYSYERAATEPASYDRRIAKIELGGSVEPLYGHTDERSSYVVDDYPYGFRARTQIRYWLEGPTGKRGWRFVSQTLNPKSGRWNKPKKSTYSMWAGAMYLDSQDHVKWAGLHEYSTVEDFTQFVKAFPRADLSIAKYVSKAKVKMLERFADGSQYWTINKVKQEPSEADKQEYRKELEQWEKLVRHM